MSIKKYKLKGKQIPECLRTIPSPPKEIFILGDIDTALDRPRLSVVGSRKATPYGRGVTQQLVAQLAGQGVAIVSGLALGIDGIAHQAALDVAGLTVAVLPTGLDKISPRTHTHLAKQILQKGGAIISEYPENTEPFPANFVARNRLVAGLGNALLVTEAAEKSGTLHTVNFALGQGKTVFAVPGNITSSQSAGTNNLIKAGATPVTDISDILNELGLANQKKQMDIFANSSEELAILQLLQDGVSDGSELLTHSKLPAATFNQTLTMLEITGRIKPLGNNHWQIK